MKFNEVTSSESEKLGVGTHTVKIAKVKETKKDGTPFVDKNGNEGWLVIYEDKDGVSYLETLYFGGGAGQKMINLLTAIGELKEGEDYRARDWQPDDIIGAYLQLTIEETKDPQYPLNVPFNGYKPAEGIAKAEPKKEVDLSQEIPF